MFPYCSSFSNRAWRPSFLFLCAIMFEKLKKMIAEWPAFYRSYFIRWTRINILRCRHQLCYLRFQRCKWAYGNEWQKCKIYAIGCGVMQSNWQCTRHDGAGISLFLLTHRCAGCYLSSSWNKCVRGGREMITVRVLDRGGPALPVFCWPSFFEGKGQLTTSSCPVSLCPCVRVPHICWPKITKKILTQTNERINKQVDRKMIRAGSLGSEFWPIFLAYELGFCLNWKATRS